MNVMEVSPRIADLAFDAYRRYGKGTGHAAALNWQQFSVNESGMDAR